MEIKMSVSLKAQKLVTIGDLLEFSRQFKGINLHLKPGVNVKEECRRWDLIKIAAANLKVSPKAIGKIAPKFTKSDKYKIIDKVATKFTEGDKYVTREELVYLFAQCFLKAGYGAPLSKEKCDEISFEERIILSTRPLEEVRNPRISRKMKEEHQ
jgi:hypothetical protein